MKQTRSGDSYYCMACDRIKEIYETFIDDDRFIRCKECKLKVRVEAEEVD